MTTLFRPDGYDNFADWRESLIKHGDAYPVSWPSTYPEGYIDKYKRAFAFRIAEEEITVFDDGTINHNCAPDWDGSS